MSIDPRAEAPPVVPPEAAVDAPGAGLLDAVGDTLPRSVGPAVGPDEATSWADLTTQEALLVIAEGITQLAGFGVAAVSVVRDSHHMQVMAVAGDDDARDTLLGTFTPIARLMEELEHAEDWGMFKFVPQES